MEFLLNFELARPDARRAARRQEDQRYPQGLHRSVGVLREAL
jgi:hypothetical protein